MINVGIIDSGIYPNKIMAPNSVAGYDFPGHTSSEILNSHGTIVAQAYCQAAPKTRLWDLKAARRQIDKKAVIKAVCFAAQNKLDMLIFAHSFQNDKDFEADMRQALQKFDGLFVCSAGNLGIDVCKGNVFPACFNLPNQLTVAACCEDGRLLKSSNYSQESVHIAAAGFCRFYSLPFLLYPNGGKYCGGTSIAAPTAAGRAAEILQSKKYMPAAQIKQTLMSEAKKIGGLADKIVCGGAIIKKT